MKKFLSLGAGVQSSTLALMMAHGEIEPVDAAIFADTQAEPANVYEWLDLLTRFISAAPRPFPVYRVTAGSLPKDMLQLRTSGRTGNKYIRTLIPAYVSKGDGKKALLGRKCTAEYKVRALTRKQRELAKVPRGCKTVMCQIAIGISYDEAHRMKPNSEAWAENYWPLVDLKMSREDCLDWMAKHGYPRPPRSACVFCPFHSDEEWVRLRDEAPNEFLKAVQIDNELRELARQQTGTARSPGDVFLHSSLRPLSEVKFADVKSHAQVDQFGNECEGLCGV